MKVLYNGQEIELDEEEIPGRDEFDLFRDDDLEDTIEVDINKIKDLENTQEIILNGDNHE